MRLVQGMYANVRSRVCVGKGYSEEFEVKAANMDMWNAPMVQSRQPLTYRLMESMGLGGLR